MSRGRGGKSNSSLTQEQLQALGCIGKDIPSVPTAPPPTFPPLLTKPVPFDISASQNYKILWKEDFLNYMRDSSYYLTPRAAKYNVQRYSDQYVSLLENRKEKTKLDFPLELIPNELKTNAKRKIAHQNKIQKKPKTADDCLKILEQKEHTEKIKLEIKDKGSDSELEEQDNEMEDDEMDDENDYGNNYFDNGEAFNEEDDNLDDGPVY